jgi:ATP-dependent DNA helicase RecQ
MKGVNRRYIRQITNRVTALGYISDDGRMSVTPKANEVLFGDAVVTIRGAKPSSTTRIKIQKAPQFSFSDELFNALRELRLEIAREEKVPAFVIFSDATLVDMCQKHPLTLPEMLDVSGVGNVKLERYGEKFLHVLQNTKRNSSAQEKPKKITAELLLQEVLIEDRPVQISRVADNYNAVLIKYGAAKTGGAKLNRLLLDAGYLEISENSKIPTRKGEEVGIVTVNRNSNHGSYIQSLFGSDAQRVCAELIIASIFNE